MNNAHEFGYEVKIKSYKIVKSEDIDVLEKRVNLLLEAGFELHGDLIVKDCYYIQAMTYDKEKNI